MSLDYALQLARANPVLNIPKMAAILTDGSRSYMGLNKQKTHPLQAKFQRNPHTFFLHAEIDAFVNAIRNGITDFSKYQLFVARVMKNGEPALAKPCKGCQQAIIHFNIRDVDWTQLK